MKKNKKGGSMRKADFGIKEGGKMVTKKQMLIALKGSVEKWDKISKGEGEDNGTDNCPLCKLYHTRSLSGLGDEVNCTGCPIQKKTGEHGCKGTPYIDFLHMVTKNESEPKVKQAAKAFQDWLEDLYIEESYKYIQEKKATEEGETYCYERELLKKVMELEKANEGMAMEARKILDRVGELEKEATRKAFREVAHPTTVEQLKRDFKMLQGRINVHQSRIESIEWKHSNMASVVNKHERTLKEMEKEKAKLEEKPEYVYCDSCGDVFPKADMYYIKSDREKEIKQVCKNCISFVGEGE